MKRALYCLILLVSVVAGLFVFQKNKALAPEPTHKNSEAVALPALAHACGITVNSPMPNEKISFPLRITITTKAEPSCGWTLFEGKAGTVLVKTIYGVLVGQAVLEADGEWMTTDPVISGATIFSGQALAPGTQLLISFTEENPSGEGIPDSLTIPVIVQ